MTYVKKFFLLFFLFEFKTIEIKLDTKLSSIKDIATEAISFIRLESSPKIVIRKTIFVYYAANLRAREIS